jgi:hypothetical protein
VAAISLLGRAVSCALVQRWAGRPVTCGPIGLPLVMGGSRDSVPVQFPVNK